MVLLLGVKEIISKPTLANDQRGKEHGYILQRQES